jgi:lactoylglutathione lyase
MRFAATICYVPDVTAAVRFYTEAFGLEQGFADPGGTYATLQAEGAVLAFAAYENAPDTGGAADKPAGFEVWIEAEDVPSAYWRALEVGAEDVHGPVTKPWGQVVAYVKDPNGILVEVGSPVSA